MSVLIIAYTCFGIPEVVFFVNVKDLVAVVIFIESVIQTICLIEYVAILNISEHVEEIKDMISGFCENRIIVFASVGIVIFIACVIFHLSHIGYVFQFAEVVATELRHVHSAYHVPLVVFEVHIIECAVVVLCKTFLSYEIGFLDCVAFGIGGFQSEFGKFVLGTEFAVVTMAVSVVNCGIVAPMFVGHPRTRENVVVLIEIVGGFVPIFSVVKFVAVSLEVSFRILREYPVVGIENHAFIQGVESTESVFVHIFIGVYSLGHE